MNNNKTRRVACDRCRDQKLRCPRVNSIAEQCARCLRARAICVTSSARPNGRPRKSPLPVADQIPAEPDVQADTPLWDHGASLDAYPDFISTSAYPFAPETPLSGRAEPGEDKRPSSRRPVYDTTDLLSFELMGEESNGGLNALDLGAAMTCAGGSLLESITDHDQSHSARWTTQCVGDTDVDEQSVTPAALVDPRIRLSKLNGNITQQLNSVRKYSWRPPLVQANCLAKGQGTDENPLAQVLQCTSQLATVIRQLSSTTSSQEVNNRTSHEPPDSAISASTSTPDPGIRNSPGVPTVLVILATWLQLVELYDELFGHVCHTLQEMSADEITAFRGPMSMIGSRVPGMDLMQGDLSVRIMIQVIEHQLESVEVALGLPDEYCILRRNGGIIEKTSATALFSRQDMEPSGLLQAVMTGVPDAHGKAAINSLRDHFKTVQDILGMPGSSN